MDTKHTLYIGTLDKDTKKLEKSVIKHREVIETSLLKLFVGYTISERMGVYKHEDGTVIRERSWVVELIGYDDYAVGEACNEILVENNQESIIIEKSDVKAVFYYGKGY